MKFIYYNVDRLSLVLPWKTHRYSKGSKSRKGKERSEVSIVSSDSSETVRQSATHSEQHRTLQNLSRELSTGFQPWRQSVIYTNRINSASNKSTSKILALKSLLWHQKAWREGEREGSQTSPPICLQTSGVRRPTSPLGQLRQVKFGSAISLRHLGACFKGGLPNVETSFPKK